MQYRAVTILIVVLVGIAVEVVRAGEAIDLSRAKVVVRGTEAPAVEQTAGLVLVEEVKKRTGLEWPLVTQWPTTGPVIVLTSGTAEKVHGRALPKHLLQQSAEGYGIATEETAGGEALIWIIGADPKGALSGVGELLRKLRWSKGKAALAEPLDLVTAPEFPIRGHQLGYRTTANSYDAWDAPAYDQYIRELALFGANAIENIPFQDEDSSHMPITRQQMNREMSRICQRYGMAYWVWTPATVDLSDAKLRAALLAEHEAFYKDCPKVDAVFFPGGDPGDNPPELVMPFLEDVSKLLAKHQPGAGIWMSLQGFDERGVDYFFQWVSEHQPDWFTGAVGGPSSPPLASLRSRLPGKYLLRDYPDITHTVRSQYPTCWIDPAFAFTSGREGPNPEPVYYSTIHRVTAPVTDGFITYSDGIHDDLNKAVWSALGWNSGADVREVVADYCRLFFGSEVAEPAADGVFALERNWSGPLATNGGVEATLSLWQSLDAQAPELRGNWRWQLVQLKAHYDAYVRARLLAETEYEREANEALTRAKEIGSEAAITAAQQALDKADRHVRPKLRANIFELCEAMFKSIGYQTSVEKYGANDPQRGALLDFVDHPLNSRWWLEDQFEKVLQMDTEDAKLARLEVLRTWENPGSGSYYDDIGNVGKSEHVLRGEWISTDPMMLHNPNPDFMWWDDGKSRVRPSWISKMDWPLGLRYLNVDPQASYEVRTTGYGECLLRVNGERVKPVADGREMGDVKQFLVPRALYQSGSILLTFDVPYEPGVNWREVSRLSEVWLIKE
ncbi:MAG: hypothetical protein KDA57_10755 [Planctomycetales bacterium]|nr:hypothetical protein [Planctomycetales bacterium]